MISDDEFEEIYGYPRAIAEINPDADDVIEKYTEAVNSRRTIELGLDQLDGIIASIKFLQTAVIEIADKVGMPESVRRGKVTGKSPFVSAIDNSYRELNEMHRELIKKVVGGIQ